MICYAVLFRIAFLIYGYIQDQHPVIKFTDIDYSVFSDAARYILQGNSPYERATYRYTPLLAMALVPCHFFADSLGGIAEIWGKVLFVAADIATGILIEEILKKRKIKPDTRCNINAALWMLNPFVAGISTRGNAESIMAFLVLATIHTLSNDQIILSGLIYGLSVHFKVYPIIYAVPFWFGCDYLVEAQKFTKRKVNFNLQLFSKRRIVFGMVSASSFLSLTYLMHLIYGHEFLQETFLYHITRKDHRHNFSLYFLHMYLSSNDGPGSVLSSVLSFAPQLSLVFILGIFLAKDIALACFLQTFAFVALNKVSTSQYFMWYLCLLPLVLPSSDLMYKSKRKGLLLLAAWIGGQALWLFFAYKLEHLGERTFIQLFLASATFYLVQMYILSSFIEAAKTV